jgi:L-ascorbate 6-phosphate lactonase
MGQAGFLIKNSLGETLALDPYLSNYSERIDHCKRFTLPVVDAADLFVDILAITHSHTDHLDMDSVPQIVKNGAAVYCCKKSEEICKNAGIDESRIKSLKVGDVQQAKNYRIEAVYANHGDLAPEALGYIISTEGVKIYFTGDTSYEMKKMEYAAKQDVDILAVPVNGEYGNTNERDAAMLAAQVKPRIAIPCHFWTLGRHRGNPLDFEYAMLALAKGVGEYTMCHAELIYYSRTGGIRQE